MLYFLYLAGIFIAKILPLKVCYSLAAVISRMYFMFAGRDKEELRENLKIVFGTEVEKKQLDRYVFEVFFNFAKYLADFFKTFEIKEKYVNDNIKVQGSENLDKALEKGKGAIVVTIHLGNWELAGRVIGMLKYQVSAIALEHEDKRVNELFVKQRAESGVKSIFVGKAEIKECFKALKRNEVLGILGDKDYTSNGIYVDFFKKKARLPKGPAVFSLKTGAPIVFCVMVRGRSDEYQMYFKEPVFPEATDDYNKDLEIIMKKYIILFEESIQKYPGQWYAFRRIWGQEKITQ
ncbi:MAG: hypothetical protein ABH844_00460 [Candidatus Omnitrophota bacterium]